MRPTYSSLGRYLLEVATYLFDPGTLPTAWLCRRRQRHRQGPHRLPERRRTRHPDRRRTIDELRFGIDFRGLLQLCVESSTKLTFDYQSSPIPATTPTAGRPTSSPAVCTGSSRRYLHEATLNR